MPVRVETTRPDRLQVVLDLSVEEPDQVCTADLAPTTTRLRVDPALTRDGRVEVVVVFQGDREDVRVVAR